LAGDDPRASAENFARFVGRPAEPEADGMIIRLDRGWLRFRAHREPRFAAGGDGLAALPCVESVTLATEDLSHVGGELSRADIAPLSQSDGGIVFGPDDAMGVRLRIVKA